MNTLRRLTFSTFVLLFALPICAKTVTITQPITTVDSIDLQSFGDLYISQGEKTSLKIQSNDDYLPKVHATVKDQHLILQNDAGDPSWEIKRDLKFYLTVSHLQKLTLSGHGDVYLAPLKADRLHLSLDASGSLKGTQLTAAELNVVQNSKGAVKFKNSVELQKLNVQQTASGDIEFKQLSAPDITLRGSSSGDFSAHLNGEQQQITLHSSGRGDYEIDQIDSPRLELQTTDSATLELTGQVDALQLDNSGSSKLKGEDLIAKDAHITLSQDGRAKLTVKGKAWINMPKTGELTLYGEPQVQQSKLGHEAQLKIK